MDWQVREVGNREFLPADVGLQMPGRLVRLAEQFLDQAQLVHDLERGRMNCVAAEVAQEVSVFFEDDDVHAGSGQQQAEHHPRRAAAGDAALGLQPFHSFDHSRRTSVGLGTGHTI